jgi:hypothetical protein
VKINFYSVGSFWFCLGKIVTNLGGSSQTYIIIVGRYTTILYSDSV